MKASRTAAPPIAEPAIPPGERTAGAALWEGDAEEVCGLLVVVELVDDEEVDVGDEVPVEDASPAALEMEGWMSL